MASTASCANKAPVIYMNDQGNFQIRFEESSTDTSQKDYGLSALLPLDPIGECLWYDSTTGIVYWWNGTFNSSASSYQTVPSPYYAPNGLPYRYDAESQKLIEIIPEEKETP